MLKKKAQEKPKTEFIDEHLGDGEEYLNEEDDFLKAFENNENHQLKTLFALFKGNYLRLIGSAVCFLIKHAPSLAMPIVVSNIINAVSSPNSGNTVRIILINAAVMLLFLAENAPMNTLYTKLYSKAMRSVEASLRSSLVRKLQQLSISYHKRMQSGRLQSKIMRDVESVQALTAQIFCTVTMLAYDITFALSVTLSKSLIVFCFFIVMVPISILMLRVFKKKLKTSNKEFRKEVENTSARLMEMVELVPVTKAHGLEDIEIKKMDTQLEKVAEKGYKLDIIQSFFGAVSWAAFQSMQVICLAFTAYLAYKKVIKVGDVVLYQTYFTTIVAQISTVLNMLPIMSKGLDSVNSIGEVLLAHDIEDNRNKLRVDRVRGQVDFNDVSFEYSDGDKPVLKHFNLHVNPGETIAFVGESGSGKTTAINMIIGFMKATGGEVLIDGLNIDTINLHTYRTHLAVVPQTSIMFSGTLRDNITYGLEDYTEEQLKRVIEYANLSDLIKELPKGLNTVVGEHGDTLSGGQRQRVSIARALMRDPSIIIFDEATSALDSISEKKIQVAIENMTKNRTTFLVAHRLSTIRNADKIAVVKDGICAEFGSFDELMEKKGEFYKLQQMQKI